MASPAKKAKVLQPCPFGKSCYRKNPAHFAEFSHPSGDDGGSVSTSSTSPTKPTPGTRAARTSKSTDTSSLPPCKYGANCYRKNVLHFAEYSHPTDAAVVPADDSDSGDTDVCNSDDEKKDDPKQAGKDPFGKGMSLVKSFTKMTEQERKDLIKMAFEVKLKLEKELAETKKQMEEKTKELNKLQEQLNKGILMVDGEKEALENDKIEYFTLLPERHYKEGSADQMHFRLAESQFYRLISGEEDQKYRVTKVQYVVNPKLVKRFKAAQEKLKKERGVDLSYPVLGFHGTDENNISPICETGFRMPGESGFKEKTDAGWYGAGIYFSEYPSYSMDYIEGAERLLLCQVLPGKVFNCTEIEEGSKKQDNCDSHMSPDQKELVIFDAHAILPCYIVHYSSPTADFKYKASPGMKRIRKFGKPAPHPGTPATILTKCKKEPASQVFEGKHVLFAYTTLKKENPIVSLVTKHKGTKGSEDKFDFLVVGSDTETENNTLVKTALEKDKPVVTEDFILESILYKKFLDLDQFLHELYDQ